jgi:formate dehydrogenase subunit beta
MKQSEHEIVSIAERLLKEGTIGVFIGYEKGTLPLRTTPAFITEPGHARRLVWNCLCSNNLTVYAPRMLKKNDAAKRTRIGILCKGCDSRSLVTLINENQLQREELFVVGIACSGIIDDRKIRRLCNGNEITAVRDETDDIVIRTTHDEQRIRKDMCLFDACLNCTNPTPAHYDMLIRSEAVTPHQPQTDPAVLAFRSKSRKERWQVFEHEISKCIRCYACRNACPNCYCKECFVEQTRPHWIGASSGLSESLFYHILRIFHQAGRCVDCGACVRACPMDIDLRLFTRVLVDEVHERFGYDAGLSVGEHPPLATFIINDSQEFMTEP